MVLPDSCKCNEHQTLHLEKNLFSLLAVGDNQVLFIFYIVFYKEP